VEGKGEIPHCSACSCGSEAVFTRWWVLLWLQQLQTSRSQAGKAVLVSFGVSSVSTPIFQPTPRRW